jgi:hypothetical protein
LDYQFAPIKISLAGCTDRTVRTKIASSSLIGKF